MFSAIHGERIACALKYIVGAASDFFLYCATYVTTVPFNNKVWWVKLHSFFIRLFFINNC